MNFIRQASLKLKFDNFGRILPCNDTTREGQLYSFFSGGELTQAILRDAENYKTVFGSTEKMQVGMCVFQQRIQSFRSDVLAAYLGCDWGRKNPKQKCFSRVRAFAVKNSLTVSAYDFVSFEEWNKCYEGVKRGECYVPESLITEDMSKFDEHDEYQEENIKENEASLRDEIGKWIKECPFTEFEAYVKKRVIGQPEVSNVLAGVYAYLSSAANGRYGKHNVLMAAPSGCGKTETFRVLRDYFSEKIPLLPVGQVDLSLLTAEGFKGRDTKSLLLPIAMKGEGGGIGLVFLDEFDKKLMPSFTSGGDNVNATIQSQILTTIEGCEFQMRDEDMGGVTINTERTMFIAMGSFDEIRKERSEKRKKNISGFGEIKKSDFGDHYDSIKKEDMIRLGASYELLGRFPILVNFRKLDDKSIDLVIDKIKTRIERDLGTEIVLNGAFRKKLHNEACSEYGCRKLESMIMERVMEGFAWTLRRAGDGCRYRLILTEDNLEIEKTEDAEK